MLIEIKGTFILVFLVPRKKHSIVALPGKRAFFFSFVSFTNLFKCFLPFCAKISVVVKPNGKITNRDVCSYGSTFFVLIRKFFAYVSLILKYIFFFYDNS